jgi:hypothetical protein
MKLILRSILLVASVLLLGASVILAVTDRRLSSIVTALSAVVTFLSAFSNLEFDTRVPRFRFAYRKIYEDLLRLVLGLRYRRRPPLREYEFRFPTNRYHDRHRVVVLPLNDRDRSGRLKSIVHVPPSADPYDVLVYSGTEPRIVLEDLNGDGRPDLFVDYVAGAHTHGVAVYRLDELERFVLIPGSKLFADWGPVEVEFDPAIKCHVIKLLSGAGAAGTDAVHVIYVIRENRVEPRST